MKPQSDQDHLHDGGPARNNAFSWYGRGLNEPRPQQADRVTYAPSPYPNSPAPYPSIPYFYPDDPWDAEFPGIQTDPFYRHDAYSHYRSTPAVEPNQMYGRGPAQPRPVQNFWVGYPPPPPHAHPQGRRDSNQMSEDFKPTSDGRAKPQLDAIASRRSQQQAQDELRRTNQQQQQQQDELRRNQQQRGRVNIQQGRVQLQGGLGLMSQMGIPQNYHTDMMRDKKGYQPADNDDQFDELSLMDEEAAAHSDEHSA